MRSTAPLPALRPPYPAPSPPPRSQPSKFLGTTDKNLDSWDGSALDLVAQMAQNGGVVERKRLIDAGIGSERIASWVKRGYLRPFHRGVYAVGSDQVPTRGHLVSALAAYGQTAVLSHRTAAALWGLCDFESPLHVQVATGTMTARRGIALHRDRRRQEDEVGLVDDLPVTTVPRLIFDLARMTPLNPMLDMTVAALRRGMLDLDDLYLQVDRQRRRKGSRELRRLVALLDPDIAKTRSWMERFFRRDWSRRDLPNYEVNATVAGYEVDCLWRKQKLIVELDSQTYHSDPAQFERDRRKQAALEAEGYTVLRVTFRMLTEDRERTMARIAAKLRSLSA